MDDLLSLAVRHICSYETVAFRDLETLICSEHFLAVEVQLSQRRTENTSHVV